MFDGNKSNSVSSPSEQFQCNYCQPPMYFANLRTFYTHDNTKHPFRCWYANCTVDCIDKSTRNAHVLQQHNAYPCMVCLDSFRTAAALSEHTDNPNEYSSFCRICSQDMKSNNMLWLHCYLFHRFECPLGCESLAHAAFEDKKQLDEHLMLRHHLFPCPKLDCHMVFRKEEYRDKHILECIICILRN